MSRLIFLSLAASALAACNPYDPDLGSHPFKCSNDGTCPEGYTCEGDDPETWKAYWSGLFPAKEPGSVERLFHGLRKAGFPV